MTIEEIKKTVFEQLKHIAPESEPENLAPGDDFRKQLDIDSFDFLRFISSLDEKMEIVTSEKDYGKLTTLNQLIPYIQSKIK